MECTNNNTVAKLLEAAQEGKKEETPTVGADWIVGLVDDDIYVFDTHGIHQKVVRKLREFVYNMRRPEDKSKVITVDLLFMVENEAGKVFYYGGFAQVIPSKKVIRFKITHTHTLRSYNKAVEKKKKEINDIEVRE